MKIAVLVISLFAATLWGQDQKTPTIELNDTPIAIPDARSRFAISGNGKILLECSAYDLDSGKVAGCKFGKDASLDETLSVILKLEKEESRESDEHCGQWGNWILDQNDNVMYRRMNPKCPAKPPKFAHPINYSICELMAIGMQHLPQGAMPRTLENPAAPPPWTDAELRHFCKVNHRSEP